MIKEETNMRDPLIINLDLIFSLFQNWFCLSQLPVRCNVFISWMLPLLKVGVIVQKVPSNYSYQINVVE